ncbi:hypothetical protein AB0B07_09450 [Streptomyces sioyaensis]|uniref:hypothetical protein n=1 Tax=Streptomyces sioyaensis TaxID=67364 RepID=UPI0033D0AD93
MPSDPARRLERAVVALTTQVRRIADALDTCADDAPTTVDDGPDVAGHVYRETLLALLSRMQRGVLLDAERRLLREHVEHLIRDRDRLAAALNGSDADTTKETDHGPARRPDDHPRRGGHRTA